MQTQHAILMAMSILYTVYEQGMAKKAAKTVIHVNQIIIRKNHKEGTREPPITVKKGKTNRYAQGVRIDGVVDIVYRPDDPLSCGARLWIETEAEVTLIGEAAPPVFRKSV